MMVEELEIVEFCQRWIPKIQKIDTNNRGFRAYSCRLVGRLSGYDPKTIQNYYGNSLKTPVVLKRLLYWIDRAWVCQEVYEQVSHSFPYPENYLQD